MDKSKQKNNDQQPSLPLALIQHYDDFADFADNCAFLCDAFASLTGNYQNLDECSIHGLERKTNWLKKRTYEIKANLKKIMFFKAAPAPDSKEGRH